MAVPRRTISSRRQHHTTFVPHMAALREEAHEAGVMIMRIKPRLASSGDLIPLNQSEKLFPCQKMLIYSCERTRRLNSGELGCLSMPPSIANRASFDFPTAVIAATRRASEGKALLNPRHRKLEENVDATAIAANEDELPPDLYQQYPQFRGSNSWSRRRLPSIIYTKCILGVL